MIPALILIVPGAGEVSFGILALLGLAKTIKERRNPLAEPGNQHGLVPVARKTCGIGRDTVDDLNHDL